MKRTAPNIFMEQVLLVFYRTRVVIGMWYYKICNTSQITLLCTFKFKFIQIHKVGLYSTQLFRCYSSIYSGLLGVKIWARNFQGLRGFGFETVRAFKQLSADLQFTHILGYHIRPSTCSQILGLRAWFQVLICPFHRSNDCEGEKWFEGNQGSRT